MYSLGTRSREGVFPPTFKPSQRDGSESTGEGQRVLIENIMGSTTGRRESDEFMGSETVSTRNFLERIYI